jgi:hypothetical protein
MRTPPQPGGYNTLSLHFDRFYPACRPRSTRPIASDHELRRQAADCP